MKLIKSLYGLKNAGREWHDLFRKNLTEWGFVASDADPCLFTKHTTDSKGRKTSMRILVFVDDMAIFHDPDSGMLGEFTKQVGDKYEYSDNENNVYLARGPHIPPSRQRQFRADLMVCFRGRCLSPSPQPHKTAPSHVCRRHPPTTPPRVAQAHCASPLAAYEHDRHS